MKKIALFVLLFVLCFGFLGNHPVSAADRIPLIQIALLLDTSNSMDGLINQAKSQLWKFVNELADAEQNGKEPQLYVALYEYGNNDISAKSGYIRKVSSFTYDLDKISEKLFALTTNGGSEYCGEVIKNATESLKWSKHKDDLRIIFIAGNEPFTQGKVNYKDASLGAKNKNITVNTIHCGSYKVGVDTKWKDGAVLTGGDYMNIDQDVKAVHIPAPQDDKIAKLGLQLNKTYIPFGQYGKAGSSRQAAQESNVKGVGMGAVIQRSVAKASKYYRSTSWDLVDAVKENKVKLEDVKKEELPQNMQKLTLSQQKKYVADQAAERAKIQNEIKKLNVERQKYVDKKTKELAAKGQKKTLDAAMIDSLRKQAMKKNFKF